MALLNPYLDIYRLLQNQPAEHQLELRKKLIWAYSWAIPSEEAIDALSKLSPLLELGAGTGYWSWLLRQAGSHVVALDHNPVAPPHWTEVEKGDESFSSRFADRSLFLCWPPYQDPMAHKALLSFTAKTVAYVGEWRGRTGDDEFHQVLEKEFVKQNEIAIPCWPGFHDRLYIFQR
jgi:hypothetical protein